MKYGTSHHAKTPTIDCEAGRGRRAERILLNTPAAAMGPSIAIHPSSLQPLGVLVSVQNLRDVAGDVAIGRRTVVVVFDGRPLRVVLSGLFAVCPFVLYSLMHYRAPTNAIMIGGAAPALLWVIATRVVICRNPKSDNITYTLYTCCYCLTLFSAFPPSSTAAPTVGAQHNGRPARKSTNHLELEGYPALRNSSICVVVCCSALPAASTFVSCWW
ncbi:hypothetical protein [Nocardia africana]|uniref:Uncharacterized protein n=1 Tax=Nocardia africana TaxID=134964 RepID=A0ABW6NTZ3_9NOCA